MAEQQIPSKEVLMERLRDSHLCSTEQTSDAKDDDDHGAYWLNDCTVYEVVEWFHEQLNITNHKH